MKERLLRQCPFPWVWENADRYGYPECELGYFRADYDGCRWWNTFWPVNGALRTEALVREFDGLMDQFRRGFPDLAALRRFFRENGEPTSDPTEFNMYLEGEHGNYWFRVILRQGDYNLYLHAFSRNNCTGDSAQ